MLGTQVSAAAGINTHEQKVLDALSQSSTTNAGTSLQLPAQYTNQASTYLRRDGVNLTATQANEIIGKINQAIALIAATDATGFRSIPTNVVEQVIKLAQEAADIVGLSLVYSTVTGAVTVQDTAGTTVLKGGQVVKQTGYSLETVLAGCSIAVLVLAIAVLTSKKTNVLQVEDQKCAL